MSVDAAIFDWDGTLANTTCAVVTSFQRTLKSIGVTVSDEFIERRIGIGAIDTFKEALAATKTPFTEDLMKRLVREKIALQIDLADTVTVAEGSVGILGILFNKVQIGLASMNNREVIDNLLRTKNMQKYFQTVVTADEVLHPKPDPEIFLLCAAKLGCRPKNCVVVEDSVFGVQAAKNAGMRCIAVPSGVYTKKELEEAKPDLIVDSLKEKERILKFILRGSS